MKPTNKTELTLDELHLVLKMFNAAKDMVAELQEGFTCTMDTASKLQTMEYQVQHAFKFQPRKESDKNDSPNYYSDYVLPEDPRAWFSDYQKKQWKNKTE